MVLNKCDSLGMIVTHHFFSKNLGTAPLSLNTSLERAMWIIDMILPGQKSYLLQTYAPSNINNYASKEA